MLGGLGFPKDEWVRKTEEFSGGWQMRIALAKLLLEKPNLLLLDEPTNHLDLEARNWLEAYLNSYRYAFILISHDRYFLDTTVRKILEVWNKQVHFYAGNYDKYLALKQQRLEQLEATYKNQQDHIHHLETFINRFRYQATKASQVQSRVKELDKIERIELPQEEKAIHFKFPQPHASGRSVIEFHGVAKSYGPKRVLEEGELHGRTWRSRGAGWIQRRRQVHADPHDGWYRTADRRGDEDSATRSKSIISRRTSTRSSTPTPSCSRTSRSMRRA